LDNVSIPKVSLLAIVNTTLDELTEFKRDVLSSASDGICYDFRTRQSVMFPAQFTLVASTNPCPAVILGIDSSLYVFASTKGAVLGEAGPLMDRIDLQVAVNRLKPEEITRQQSGRNHLVRKRSQLAITPIRALKQNHLCVAMPRCRHLRQWCQLDDASRNLLEAAITSGSFCTGKRSHPQSSAYYC